MLCQAVCNSTLAFASCLCGAQGLARGVVLGSCQVFSECVSGLGMYIAHEKPQSPYSKLKDPPQPPIQTWLHLLLPHYAHGSYRSLNAAATWILESCFELSGKTKGSLCSSPSGHCQTGKMHNHRVFLEQGPYWHPSPPLSTGTSEPHQEHGLLSLWSLRKAGK